MKLQKGDMFKEYLSIKAGNRPIIMATTNAVVANGKLVMGAGAALGLKNLFPESPHCLGGLVVKQWEDYFLNKPVWETEYGCIYNPNSGYGAFQTKYHFNNPSPLKLIERSVVNAKINQSPSNTYWCNFPGIGLGGLKYKDVLPLISVLPDNWTFWTL